MSQNIFQTRLRLLACRACRLAGLPTALLILLVSVCGTAARRGAAQITKVGDSYMFRVKFTKGAVIHYVMTTTATPVLGTRIAFGNRKPKITTIPMHLTVKDVKGKIATLEMSIGPSISNNKEVSPVQTAQMQVDDHNKAVNREKNGPGGAGLPPKPLKVGESYSINQTAQRNGRPITIQATYTFRGIKTVVGRQVAEIFSKTTTKADVVTTGTGTIYFSVADGSLVGTTTRQSAKSMNSPKPITMITETVITRQDRR